ncbi:MAG TPA: UDP-N-acetylglucosamine 2-epimerase [Polyangia bacterium]|jgi:UDP-hydrolysing UDP-N-acetyl-D-glucosamine 2-epimerase|nr:UDP-N-acetylglucosamine 2-epimerase [Polyangia bacterium]
MRVAVLTTGRQDWGILRSVCVALRDAPDFDLRLLVGGMHCSDRFGRTETMVRADGFAASETLAWLKDDGETAAGQSAAALTAVAEALRRQAPECLLVVGDRLETIAAVVAATLCLVPVVHLHGGEDTEGAFDNSFRNAITKMSHLHLVSHPDYARRIAAMGEDPAAIHVMGSPALDNLQRGDLATRAELEALLGLPLEAPLVVVTVHPTTLASAAGDEVGAVVAAMASVPATYVITMPNSDPGNESVRDALRRAAAAPRRTAVEALGERRYWGLLQQADAVLGNSSSGVIEAPALALPTVNVGDRQRGRIRGPGVIDVGVDASAIAAALQRALDPSFRQRVRAAEPPFLPGNAAARVLSILRGWSPPSPPRKVSVFQA